MPFTRPLFKPIFTTPSRIFWTFALMHLVLWTIVPSLVCQNLPLDVIEGYAWGREWLIGTYKHPPMQAWILEIIFHITGRARWAPYFTSQIAIVTAFWAVWQTGRRIAGEKVGLVGVLILEGIIYYNFTSYEFNPNLLQLPFWSLAGWSFYNAIKDNKIKDWLLLGLWSAAGMYSKYSTAVFLIILITALLAHRDGRVRLKSSGPYLAVIIATLLFMPQLMWLIHNNFIPWQYTVGRLERTYNQYSAALTTTLMVVGQIIALMFAMLLVIILYNRRNVLRRARVVSFDRLFLTLVAFGPFTLMFCLSLIFGYHIRDMWETPFWNFIGLWAIVFMRPALHEDDLHRFAAAWIFVFILGLTVFIATETLSPYLNAKPRRTNFPGKALSNIIIDEWHARFHTPLHYVIGDTWPAGNVAWYADDRPHVVMDGNLEISPWIDMADLKKSGGIIVWCITCGTRSERYMQTKEMQSFITQADIQQPLVLKRMTFADVPPVTVGWAILSPEKIP